MAGKRFIRLPKSGLAVSFSNPGRHDDGKRSEGVSPPSDELKELAFIRVTKDLNYLRSIFPYDAESGTFTIEITIDHYDEIFNEWDPSPFRRRDLHPDLTDYLDYCSKEIPLKYPIRISIEVPEEKRNAAAEKMVEQGFRNNIRMDIFQLNKEIGKSNTLAIAEMVFAFFFLFTAYYLMGFAVDNIFYRAAIEGISIWGWVLEWQGILGFFFAKPDYRRQKKLFARYLDAELVFKNQKQTFTTTNPVLLKKRTVSPHSPTPAKKKRKLPAPQNLPHATPLKRKKR